jgi:hypothetical protein
MKRLALIVSAIAMTATAAHAQDATEFKNGGEFRIRYENFFAKSGMENSKNEQHEDARLKWDMNIRKGEKLQAHVSLLHNARFGGASPDGNFDMGGSSQAQYSPAANNGLVVNRAWGWWRASDMVSFKVGRFGIEFADGAVFSENDWQNTPFANEGIDIAIDSSVATFNVYGIKQAENAAVVGNSDPENNFYMVTADLKNMPSAIKMANIHLIDVVRDNTGTGSANWQHLGLTVGGDVAGFMYKATGAFQFGSFLKPDVGTEQKLSTNMFDLMVGYGMPETMGLKVSAGYHMDTGDDSATGDKKTYQTLNYDRHNYAGLMDVVQWGNLSYFNVNASIMPMEDLEAGLGFYMFSKTKSAGATIGGRGFTGNGAGTALTTTSDSSLGSEVDLFANKSYGPDLKIGARYSMFMPGDALKNTATKQEKMAHEGYLQASITF